MMQIALLLHWKIPETKSLGNFKSTEDKMIILKNCMFSKHFYDRKGLRSDTEVSAIDTVIYMYLVTCA